MRPTFILYLTFFLVCSCSNKTTKEKQGVAKEQHHAHAEWSYEGESSPEHWTEIEKNSACGGQHQSPINYYKS